MILDDAETHSKRLMRKRLTQGGKKGVHVKKKTVGLEISTQKNFMVLPQNISNHRKVEKMSDRHLNKNYSVQRRLLVALLNDVFMT